MDDRLQVLILHIRDVAMELNEFTRTHKVDDLRRDVMVERGFVMSVMIIGELAGRIVEGHPDVVADMPEVPWARIRGLRNRIAHGYFDLDLDTVWDVVVNSIPEFAGRLAAKLEPPHTGT